MNFNLNFFIPLFSIIFGNGLGRQFFEGDSCSIDSSGTRGICKLISSCPSAIQAIRKQEPLPPRCGFHGFQSIVCCADIPTSNSRFSDFSLTRTSSISPLLRNIILQEVGDKSKQKCKEYEKYVYVPSVVVPIPGRPSQPLINECPIVDVENIVGEEDAKPKEFPHMALVGFDGDDNTIHWNCEGSLISEKFVLSAAHCTYYRKFAAKYILLGELELGSDTDDALPQQISIKNTFPHPDFVHSSKYHDIALFELEHEANLNTYTRPACLNTNPSLTNILGVASGWGSTSYLGDTSKKLQKVTLEIFTDAECKLSYQSNKEYTNGIVEETQFCAGSHNESKEACQGGPQSGGPIQIIGERSCSYDIIGVTSFGKACVINSYRGVYTRVSAYIKWIEDIVWP